MHASSRRNCSIAAAILLSIAPLTTATAAQADEVAHLDSPPPAGGEGGGGSANPYIKELCNRYLFTGNDPRDCHGDYSVYDFSTGATQGTLIFHVQTDNDSIDALWQAVGQGYQSAQDWCSSNSLTCGVITSAGVTVVANLIFG